MSANKRTPTFLQLLTGLLVALTILGAILEICPRNITDDAFIITRYADRLISDTSLAWNPGGEPTYGVTALAFLVVAVPCRMFAQNNVLLAAVSTSFICGVVFLLLLWRLLIRNSEMGAHRQWTFAALAFLSLANSIEIFGTHFVTGMDTTFSMAFLTVYLILCLNWERSQQWAWVLAMGVFGGLAYVVRPDLMLFTTIVPLMILLLEKSWVAKRQALAILGLTGAILLSQLGICYRVFSSVVPLPFFAKATPLYGPEFTDDFRFDRNHELAAYLLDQRIFLVIIAVAALVKLRRRSLAVSPLVLGLLFSATLYIAYFFFAVTQIAGEFQRFYYPVLPVIVFLAARGFYFLWPVTAQATLFKRNAGLFRKLGVLSLAVFLISSPAKTIPARFSQHLHDRSIGEGVLEGKVRYERNMEWHGLLSFSKLPDDLVFASTEVGYLGVLNPHKAVFDLAGLNDRQYAQSGFSADRLFAQDLPDVLYYPPNAYSKMRREIAHHPVFQKDYLFYPQSCFGKSMDVAIWKKSRYVSTLVRTLEELRLKDADCMPGI